MDGRQEEGVDPGVWEAPPQSDTLWPLPFPDYHSQVVQEQEGPSQDGPGEFPAVLQVSGRSFGMGNCLNAT